MPEGAPGPDAAEDAAMVDTDNRFLFVVFLFFLHGHQHCKLCEVQTLGTQTGGLPPRSGRRPSPRGLRQAPNATDRSRDPDGQDAEQRSRPAGCRPGSHRLRRTPGKDGTRKHRRNVSPYSAPAGGPRPSPAAPVHGWHLRKAPSLTVALLHVRMATDQHSALRKKEALGHLLLAEGDPAGFVSC